MSEREIFRWAVIGGLAYLFYRVVQGNSSAASTSGANAGVAAQPVPGQSVVIPHMSGTDLAQNFVPIS